MERGKTCRGEKPQPCLNRMESIDCSLESRIYIIYSIQRLNRIECIDSIVESRIVRTCFIQNSLQRGYIVFTSALHYDAKATSNN